MFKKWGCIFMSVFVVQVAFGQDLPSSIKMLQIEGGTFTMGSNHLIGSPDQKAAAPEHQVTLSDFSISETEITNEQYLAFLNAALADGLIEINTGTMGPDKDARLVQGTAKSAYSGKTLYNLDGIRVLKDHDNADNDNDPFTGDVEPENPLNIAYIDYSEGDGVFFLKDPHNADDFDWKTICDYQDYGTTKGSKLPGTLNDFDDWAGSGQNLSDELEGWTKANPSAASKLPKKEEVAAWPVTFVRWWGAWAFADYYDMQLPTEAQWEYVAKGGKDFTYAVYDGTTLSDANWNQDQLKVATHHVREAKSGKANPFGCYNLAGNAWEWILDNYKAPYSAAAATDPLIEENGSTKRCWRGGSWNYHEATLQSAMRFYDEEDRGNDHFGFRIAGKATSVGSHEPMQENDIQLFPNPACSTVHLGVELEMVEKYVILNTNGKIEIEGKGNQVSVAMLPIGIYVMVIHTREGMTCKRLHVMR